MKALLIRRESALMILIGGLLLYAARTEPNFVTGRTQTLLASHVWEMAIVALPMLLIVISGGIDLSVGSIVALCSIVLGLLVERGFDPIAAAAIAMAAGLAQGLANGWLIAKLRVHPLIVTLATMAAFRGIAEGISLARPISGYPDSFLALSTGKLAGIAYPGLVFLTLTLLSGYILTQTVFGRWVRAIGTQERASEFSAIPVARVKIWLYALSGACAGIAAVFLVARNNTAKADTATGMELEVITAVVLGGASIQGGSGSVLGLVLGLLAIHETREFVSWHWRQSELNLIVIGGLLIVSVLVQKGLSARSRSRVTA